MSTAAAKRQPAAPADALERKAARHLAAARKDLERVEGAILAGDLPVTSRGVPVKFRDFWDLIYYPTRLEADVIADHPQWVYLVTDGDVRPATEEELARYEGQRTSASHNDLYAIQARAKAGENEPLLPETIAWAEARAAYQPEPDVIDGVIVPDNPALEEIQHDSTESLKRWGARKSDLTVVAPLAGNDDAAERFMAAFSEDPDGDEDRAEPPAEVHHDTVVLKAVEDDK